LALLMPAMDYVAIVSTWILSRFTYFMFKSWDLPYCAFLNFRRPSRINLYQVLSWVTFLQSGRPLCALIPFTDRNLCTQPYGVSPDQGVDP
jgi:hypothetical protein